MPPFLVITNREWSFIKAVLILWWLAVHKRRRIQCWKEIYLDRAPMIQTLSMNIFWSTFAHTRSYEIPTWEVNQTYTNRNHNSFNQHNSEYRISQTVDYPSSTIYVNLKMKIHQEKWKTQRLNWKWNYHQFRDKSGTEFARRDRLRGRSRKGRRGE